MRSFLLLSLGMMIAVFGCDKADFQGAEAEVKKTEIQLDLPKVPDLNVPKSSGGERGPREMRLMGRNLLDTDVEVKGFVTWIYDCIVGGGPKGPIGKDGMTDKQKRAIIAKKPTLCWRPHFIIGDTESTSPDKGIWVVEVPRAPRKDELRRIKRMPKAERDALPKVPVIKIGDEVIISGKWSLRSPKGFANSTGLLVYGNLRHEGDPIEPPTPTP